MYLHSTVVGETLNVQHQVFTEKRQAAYDLTVTLGDNQRSYLGFRWAELRQYRDQLSTIVDEHQVALDAAHQAALEELEADGMASTAADFTHTGDEYPVWDDEP